jgi:hypothetical protein
LKQTSRPLSDYLAGVGSYGDTAGTDIIVAIDLTDVLPPKFIADRLRENEVLKGKQVDIDKIATVFAGVRGARLGIKIGTKCNGMLVIDFKDDPAPLKDFAKPLLLSMLGNAGVLLEEMEEWKPTVGKNSISLQGYISDEGMRRLMGIVELPDDAVTMMNSGGAEGATSAKSNSGPDDSLVRETSRNYFQSIERQLDSLRLKKNDAKSFGQIAAWIDGAARHIDRMSSLNVDPELVNYGAAVSVELRQMVAALQGIGIQSGARQAQIYDTDSSYYDDGTNVDGARRAVRAEEKAAGSTSALDISRQIANQSAAVRRKMTDRYKIDF